MPQRKPDIDPKACAEAASICACFHFRKASRAVTQLFDSVLQESGLRSTQFVMLVAIQAGGGPVRLPDLAQTVNVDRSTLTRNLQPLERKGLISMGASPNSRASTTRLTAKGRRLLGRALPLWEEAQTRFVSQVGARRWRALLRDLVDVVDAAHEA